MKNRLMKKFFALIATLCLIASVQLPPPASADGTTYYVDSANGDDANSGTSESAAWQSLSKVNATVFNPGDTILFKTGGVWNGQLSPQGSGEDGNPIVIDMYGTGSKPIINGGGLNNTGAVYLVNQEYWEINNLEVTNDDDLSVNNTANVRMGIYYKIDANIDGNNRVFHHIYIRNCYIHDVDGNENGSAASAGISGEIVGPSTASLARFDDIRIENNTFTKVDRTAIQPVKLNIFTCTGTDSCFRDGVRNNNQWSTNVYVAYNTMNDIGGDGILMRETKDALVEHNVLTSFGTRALSTTAVAGMWLWNANHTIFQFNEVYGGPASNQDGCAFDFDYYGIDTVYQYNYSHDNPMGTILLMGANENDIFRYNISQNDGMVFRHFAYNETTPAYFYNNIFYYDGANHKISGDSATKLGYHFYNNIFYNTSTTTPTKWGSGDWDQLTFSHNIFYEASGQHTQQEPFDPYGMMDDPKFVNPGSGSIGLDTLQGYKLQTDSPAIDAGIESPESEGINDFFGTAINASKPDIGVQELSGTPAANSTMRYVPQQQMSTVATSYTTGHSPLNAIDGQDQTYWQSEEGSNPSLTIALGGTYNIDRIVYVPSADDAAGVITNYQVYASTDGEEFTKVATGTWTNNTYRKRAVFPSVSASYIKIIALHSSGHTSAAEVQVGIGTGTDGSGLYTKIPQSSMTATASSEYSSSYAASKAIDGSTSTYWYPSSLPTAANPQSIILTLNQQAAISKFEYTPYPSAAYTVIAYNLYVSTDSVNFTQIPAGTGNPGTWTADGTIKTVTFDPVEAKAIKFEITATGGSRPAVLELNLYSPDNTVPAPAQPTNVTASPMDSQVNLTWSIVTDATSYNVKRSMSSGGPYATIADNITGTAYSDTGLENGTTYYYVVTAANSGGESSNSKEVSATPAEKTYTASFESNGGSTVDSQTVSEGGTATAPTDPTKTGFTFDGWYADSDLTTAFKFSTAITNDLTLYAKWEVKSTSGGSSGSTTVNNSTTEQVQATGNSTVVIERTTYASGKIMDTINFTSEQANQTIRELTAAGSNTARIVVPDPTDKVAELNVTVPKKSTDLLASGGIDLELVTNHAQIGIPSDSLQGLQEDTYFRMTPIRDSVEQEKVRNGAVLSPVVTSDAGNKEVRLIGVPVKIETNLQGRPVTLVLPLADTGLSQALLANLGIYVEHSDGTVEFLRGEIVADDNAGTPGIRFTVSKFSTFAIVYSDGLSVSAPEGEADGSTVEAYISGYDDGTFRPDNQVTRAEIAVLLARLFGSTREQLAGLEFSDVAEGYWAKDAIDKVAAMGLMRGFSDGGFRPKQPITRGEMAAIVSRLLTGVNATSTVGSFSDLEGHWAQAAIKQVKAAGIITGYADGTFRPQDTLTRAEAVVILNRLQGREPLTGIEPTFMDVPETYWAYGQIQAASAKHSIQP